MGSGDYQEQADGITEERPARQLTCDVLGIAKEEFAGVDAQARPVLLYADESTTIKRGGVRPRGS
jgi:hypothetical protein